MVYNSKDTQLSLKQMKMGVKYFQGEGPGEKGKMRSRRGKRKHIVSQARVKVIKM